MNTGKQINAMVVILFLTLIAIGAYTIFDPVRSDTADEDQITKAADRGANTFALNCRLCHGDRGQGGVDGGRLALAAMLDRPGLQGIEDGVFTQNAFDEAFDLVTNTIVCGRIGSPMPAWSEDQGGTLNFEQIRQLAVLITEGEWEAAQHHADEIDAEATSHATVQMPGGSFGASGTELTVSHAGSFERGQYVRIRIDEESEERLRILPDQLLVERAVNGSEASAHESGTEIASADGDDVLDRLNEDVGDEDTAFVVRDPEQFDIGDVLTLGDEEVEVIGHQTGLPTTGQVLVEGIGRTPDRVMVSDSAGISVDGGIRINDELMTVTAVVDDGDPEIELDAAVSPGADRVSISDPVFFGEDYVLRVGDERMRIVGPIALGQSLSETIGVAETTFLVSGTEGLPTDRPIRMGSELLMITEVIAPASVTVKRHVDDTSAASHGAGTSIDRLVEPVEGDEAEDAEPQYEPTGQTVTLAISADGEEIEVTGTSGLALEQTYKIGDELVEVVATEPARIRVERGVLDSDRAPHARRVAILDGNLLEVERAFADTDAAGHESGDSVFMSAIEIEREVEGSLLEAHTRNAEIFLGNELIVERGVLGTEPAEHANGGLIYNFPVAPDDPSLNMGACGQPFLGGEPDAQPTVPGPQVAVSLNEFSVEPQPDSIEAGSLNFVITNDGVGGHNFRIIATDLAPDALPVVDDRVDEDELDVVGGISSLIGAGTTQSTSATLAAGSYVLICNVPTHYDQGMYVGFEVAAP